MSKKLTLDNLKEKNMIVEKNNHNRRFGISELTQTEVDLLTQEESMNQTIGSAKFKRVIELLKNEKNYCTSVIHEQERNIKSDEDDFKEFYQEKIDSTLPYIAELDLAIHLLSKHSK